MGEFLHGYNAYVNSLDPSSQAAVIVFTPSLVLWTALRISQEIKRHRRNVQPRRGNKIVKLLGWLLFFGGLYYFAGRYAWLAEIISWPDRHFRMWREHGAAMWIAFMVAAYVSMPIGKLYALLFLRGGRGRSQPGGIVVGSSPFNLLPDPPPGYGWYSPTKTRERIVGTRTRTTYEEE